jgi:hypothetical protein
MRFSNRSKMGVLLSLVTIIALLSTLMVTIISRGAATHASSASTFQSSTGQAVKAGSIKPPSSIAGSHNAMTRSSEKNLRKINVGLRTLGQSSHNSSAASGIHSTSVSLTTAGNLLHNFNGLSDLANASLNPFLLVEPPDQGLCPGYLTDQITKQKIQMEFEMVNDVIAIYLPNGKLVAETSLGTFLGDINFPAGTTAVAGDPRCHFDRQTHTFFFTVTVIGTTPFIPGSQSRIDLAVINADTQVGAEYLIDTTDATNPNCPCFADAPNFGIDNNAVYVSADEFPISTTSFQGSELFALSKAQLVNQTTVNFVKFFQLSLGGIPVTGLQPAINVSSAGSEYLENSFPYDASGNPIPVQNQLGLWHVTNDAAIANGGTPKLSATIMQVENYAFPVPAASTGSGATSNGFTSAAFLNPDDDRMQQVEGIVDEGNIELWSAVDTAISIPGDPQVRDGVAWFRINPQSASVVEQNYVDSAGNYLLYPAILHTSHGSTAIVFSVTSPTLNPSAAYTVSLSSPTNFASINIAAQGANPYITSFNRWGDYSAAALALNGNDIWLGTEYVPVQTATSFFLNWGTELFEVAGS